MEEQVIVMPTVALRGMTILPGMVQHFDVSRPKSIAAVEKAMLGDQKLFLVSQRHPEIPDPELKDLYQVGTIGVVKQLVKLPGGVIRVMAEGEERAELLSLNADGSYLEGEAEIRATEEENLGQVEKEAMIRIVKEKLEETISYNVSNEKKWYVRIIPLCVKWAALGFIFRRNDRAHTITLSNIGPISVDEEYRDEVEGFHLIIGVSKQQPVKCGICSYGEDMVISFTTVFADARLQRRFFGKLEADGVKAQFESNGIAMPEADQKNYPEIGYDISKWKKLVWIFYAVLAAAAVIVGVVNLATYSGLWWSVIAIFGMAYAGLTMRYSILRHANLGKSLMIETLGMAVLLLVTDHVLGYQGWSVNYGIPSIILFADIAIVFLILVNRMNWQSYFMYQIAITLFSFIPIALWAAGFITQPVMAIITVILSVLILTMTVLLGDRRVKNELIRRFHL